MARLLDVLGSYRPKTNSNRGSTEKDPKEEPKDEPREDPKVEHKEDPKNESSKAETKDDPKEEVEKAVEGEGEAVSAEIPEKADEEEKAEASEKPEAPHRRHGSSVCPITRTWHSTCSRLSSERWRARHRSTPTNEPE